MCLPILSFIIIIITIYVLFWCDIDVYETFVDMDWYVNEVSWDLWENQADTSNPTKGRGKIIDNIFCQAWILIS